MKILVFKQDNDIVTKFSDGDKLKDFDYITLINLLFENDIPDLMFDGTIDEEDKNKISKMYNEICNQVKPVRDTKESQ